MSSTKNGISIIIPCYNAWPYLSQAINSVITHMRWALYEIIVSDDGSDDSWETEKVLDYYDWKKHIKIVRNIENKWAQHARNLWLNAAKFAYVHMLDADDKLNNEIWNGRYGERAIDILAAHKSVGFVHCPSRMFEGFEGYTISPYPLTETLVVKKHHVPTYMTYRLEDATRENIYHEEITKRQDWSAWVGILNSRLKASKGRDIVFLKDPYHLYREYSSKSRLSEWNIDEKEMILKTIEFHPDIFQKHYPMLSQEEIAEKVSRSKPSKLVDLLYVTNTNSLDLARKIVEERWWALAWELLDIDTLLQVAEYDLEQAKKLVMKQNIIAVLTPMFCYGLTNFPWPVSWPDWNRPMVYNPACSIHNSLNLFESSRRYCPFRIRFTTHGLLFCRYKVTPGVEDIVHLE